MFILSLDISCVKENTDKDNCRQDSKPWRSKRLKMKENDIKTSSLTCKHCHKYFRNEEMLIAHGLDHDEDMFPIKQRLSTDLFEVTLIEKKRQYSCRLCKHVFKERKNAKAHQKDHDSSNPWFCEYCNKHCMNDKSFREHLGTHSEKDIRQCEDCGKLFKLSQKSQHMAIYCSKQKITINDRGGPASDSFNQIRDKSEKEASFICSKCCSVFDTEFLLREHYTNYHSDRKLYSCSVCLKSFPSLKECSQHASSHEESTYHCMKCKETFTLSEDLEMHYQMSEDCLEIACTECNVRFNNVEELSLHLQSVATPIDEEGTAVIIYICGYCQRGFHLESTFTEHTHVAENSHKICPICDETFDDAVKYANHITEKHEGCITRRCIECNKIFGGDGAIKRHAQLVHSKDRLCRCIPCGRTFFNRDDLKRHVTTQTHVTTLAEKSITGKKYDPSEKLNCSICDRVCQNIAELKRHEFTHQKVEVKNNQDLLQNNSPAGASASQPSLNLKNYSNNTKSLIVPKQTFENLDAQVTLNAGSDVGVVYLENVEETSVDQTSSTNNVAISFSDFNIISSNEAQNIIKQSDQENIIAYIENGNSENTPIILTDNSTKGSDTTANLIQLALNAAVSKALSSMGEGGF